MSVRPAPAMRAPFAPARAVSGIAAENQISSASRTTTIYPTLPPVLPRLAAYATRSNVIRKPKARRRSHGPLRQEEDQGVPRPSGDHGRIHGVSALLGFSRVWALVPAGWRVPRKRAAPTPRAIRRVHPAVRARTFEMAERADVARERVRVRDHVCLGPHEALGDADLRGSSSSRWAPIPF